MNYKLISFDLDGTLAPIGKGISIDNIKRLRQLESMGVTIALCSGKTEYYLCGLLRQIELEHPVIVGENGAVVRFGIDLPPKLFKVQTYSQEAHESIRLLKQKIEEELPGIYFQPNIVGLTPFPKSEQEFDIIQSIIDGLCGDLKDVIIYRHADSFDITPSSINKFSGMTMLTNICGVSASETIAVGDGVNDYPMFEFAGYSVGINTGEGIADFICDDISTALDHLIKICK